MTTLDVVSLVAIAACVLVIIVGIYEIHSLPGEIAERRNHPQAQAITVCSIMGLIVFPFWMVALVWAYAGVIGVPLQDATRSVAQSSAAGDGSQAAARATAAVGSAEAGGSTAAPDPSTGSKDA